ncbi:DEAD/DEAH box helicase [Pseudomonas knackmussii]|uniref:DEAD/DEAH box helicase n=1 Tax=Pseudomonas knackmussii TaxID=65741 RepID=UPI0013647D0E|nr:DEAD/DEAH box helicase [Pseudomonas knackmussii]
MEIFEKCQEINTLLGQRDELAARNELIKLLDHHERHKIPYTPLLNSLIREIGLFPYLKPDTASWQDRFVFEAFKVDTGLEVPITLHREQSSLLKQLLDGTNLAVSAPTSFGKSFVIDAFISIKKPDNVVIIVPTIALTDETRRRLYPKFSDTHKIITTTESEPAERNIFIFPQERALSYISKIKKIDILVIDEFYKASKSFDKERSASLLRAILKLGSIAKQRYFLAPNISRINENLFTRDMKFISLDFNTVYLEKNDYSSEIDGDEERKSKALVNILSKNHGKTLIYAGTYADIDRVSEIIRKNIKKSETPLLASFANWLRENYSESWDLISLVEKSTGIHNGQIHRSLGQLQVKLFEEMHGLNKIVSTSSIIEGVNTSAENVIVWRNKNGKSKLNDFTYKNIIGRGGRMFKHFIGKIFILDAPPEEEATQLNLTLPDELLPDISSSEYKQDLTNEQIAKIISYQDEMHELLGFDYESLQKSGTLQGDANLIRNIARDMRESPAEWSGLAFLNSENPFHWERPLYKAINMLPGKWDIEYSKFVAFVKVLSKNWTHSVPQLLKELAKHNIDIASFFMLERNVSFKLSSLLNDINTLQKSIFKNSSIEISSFSTKLSHAFLPSVVYDLEEYGLPRMLSKKLHGYNFINFLNESLTIHETISHFNDFSADYVCKSLPLTEFEKYIIKYFYEGIRKPQ